MNAGIGHNNGPSMDRGVSYRRHCWTKARKQLLPSMPIEVLRGRVRRAREIGLDYKTYATVRATTGRDIVAFLFSTNALRLFREAQTLEQVRAEKLAGVIACERRALTIAPLTPDMVLAGQGHVLDSAAAAPGVHNVWSKAVIVMDAARGAGLPADAVLMVGDTTLEREWSQAGRLAGYLDAARFFAPAP